MHMRRLVSGLPAADREHRWFLMLQVWVDDSGRGQDPVFVLAGYIARVRNWEALADRWRGILNQKPRIGCLKGKEAASLTGEFHGWTAAERDERVLQLVGAIEQYSLAGVRVVIPHEGFRQTLRGGRIAKESRWYFGQPYYLAFDAIFASVLSYVRRRPFIEKVEFIFDYGVVARRNLEQAYAQLLKGLGKDAALIEREPVFRDDRSFPPLQAADLLAWHVRREHDERAKGRILQSPVWDALSRIDEIQIELTRKDLADMRDETLARTGRSPRKPRN
jgi:hypothetical protein